MKIAIHGLGIIGGSLGLAIKHRHPNSTITGIDKDEVIVKALRRGAIDYGTSSIEAGVNSADIVFLCTPVSTILKSIPIISQHVHRHTIVTDVGSTKRNIVRCAKNHFKNAGIFVGGHPMTGSERSGIEHADPLLFENSTYVLCHKRNINKSIDPLVQLLQSLGCNILNLDAKAHDSIASAISHLPQILALVMMTYAGKKNKTNNAYMELAAGGFRDITRIASSRYAVWGDILQSNNDFIVSAIDSFSRQLQSVKTSLAKGKYYDIEKLFNEANILRNTIPKNSKGFLSPLHDIYVSVEDTKGMLSKITRYIASSGVNIRDIELLRTREGIGSAFRLSFANQRDAEKAITVLMSHHITARK